MSLIFEAVVVEGTPTLIRDAFDRLDTPLALRLYRVNERGYVILSQLDPGRLFKWEEVHRLAVTLSVEFGTTLSAHYDNRGGVKVAFLSRDGKVVREFANADEVWVPMDENGNPLTDGPRYPGDNLPPDEECDCIQQAIDVGLETSGFDRWLTMSGLQDLAIAEKGWCAHRIWGNE